MDPFGIYPEELGPKRHAIDTELIPINQQLNVLKRIYDGTVNQRPQEAFLLKKRNVNEFIEAPVTVDKARMVQLGRPIVQLVSIPASGETVAKAEAGEKSDDFKDILSRIISKFHDSSFSSEFFEMTKLFFKIDRQTFDFMTAAVVSSVRTNPDILTQISQWLCSVYSKTPADYAVVYQTVVQKLSELSWESMPEFFPILWKEFIMVSSTVHPDH
jgi:hypothetical protein